MAVLLALLSSLIWGAGDFFGGTASRRTATVLVVLGSQAAGLVVALVVAAAAQSYGDATGYVPWAVLAGLVGAIGLLLFYRALAIGTMGVVSPIAALGVVVPVGIALLSGALPSVLTGIGIAIAVIAIVAVSGPERGSLHGIRPVVMAGLSAICFGVALYAITRGSAYSTTMTMVLMRSTSVPLLAVVAAVTLRRGAARPAGPITAPAGGRRLTVLFVLLAGIFDITANITFAVASTLGSLAVVAVLGSLYPAGTVLLARIVHGERLARVQQVGVLAALIGVALISAGS